MIISLTGFMGCGKSSVGRELSTLLSCSYADLDTIIETKTGRSIAEIFASEGEATFRQMELDSLRSLVSDAPETCGMILSLGGGTVMSPECAELIHNRTVCIYLRASVSTLLNHLEGETEGRPILAGSCPDSESDETLRLRQRVEELMGKRSGTYENTAHIIVDIDGKNIGQIAEEIKSFHLSRACL